MGKRATLKRTLSQADRLEPPVATAFVKGTDKLRARVSIDALANALAARDVKRAMAICFTEADLAESLAPAAAKVRDAVFVGGRLGSEQVNGR